MKKEWRNFYIEAQIQWIILRIASSTGETVLQQKKIKTVFN